MKKIIVLCLLLLQLAIPVIAQQIHELIATQGREDDFPAEGYYAATNLFPRNSLVELRNPSNGRVIQVIVVKRVNSPGSLMLLSDEASAFLEIGQNNPKNIFASAVTVPGLTNVDIIKDLPFSVDPEINPSAEFGDPNSFVFNQNALPQNGPRIAQVPEPLPPAPEPLPPAPEPLPPAPEPLPPAPEPLPPAPEPLPPAPEPLPPAPEPLPPAPEPLPPAPEPLPPAPEPLPPAPEPLPPAPEPLPTAPSPLADSAVSPAFDLVRPDHLYWPPEYDAEAPKSEESANPEPIPPSDGENEEAPVLASSGYASALGTDPVDEWIDRIRNRYPDRQLFLPSQGSDVEEKVGGNVATPAEDAPTLSKAVADEPAVEEPSDFAFDYTQDLPTADLLARPQPEVSLSDQALRVPKHDLPEDTIRLSNIRTAAPEAREPEPGSISLAQYIDPIPLGKEPAIGDESAPAEVIVTLEEAEPRSPEPPEITEKIARPPEIAEEIPEELINGANLLSFLEESKAPTAEPLVSPEKLPEESPEDLPEESPEDLPEESPKDPVEAPTQPLASALDNMPDATWAENNLPLVYSLESGGYYLQVGAFTNPRSAKRVVEEVSPGYPLAVLPAEQEDRRIYQIFVGPLNDDEKGSVLYWFKARGYRDAFIRKGT